MHGACVDYIPTIKQYFQQRRRISPHQSVTLQAPTATLSTLPGFATALAARKQFQLRLKHVIPLNLHRKDPKLKTS